MYNMLVYNTLITEYDEEETFAMLRAECEARGKARGIAEAEGKTKGIITTLVQFINEGLISEDNAAERANMTLGDFRKAVALYCD